MTEASYHLKFNATHKMVQTNLNIGSRKTDEKKFVLTILISYFYSQHTWRQAEDENSTGQKSLLASWELFSVIQFPSTGLCKNTIPVLEQAFCQRQSSGAEPLHQWRKARKLNSDSEPSATNKNIKELDFATMKVEFNLKLIKN